MAIEIQELQVETRVTPEPATGTHKTAALKRPQMDLKAELQKINERKLRLRAD